jgi:hypothetical protein
MYRRLACLDATLLLDRILGEKVGHGGSIEIRSDLRYRAFTNR